jgi:hypothetical protein
MRAVRADSRRRAIHSQQNQDRLAMTTPRDITIYQGQAFELSLDYAGTAGRGQRMHIRLADSTATVIQILTHNGDANARVIFDTDALDITIGASVSAGWVVLADRVEWVYDIEDYDLADEDNCVIPYRGKVIVRGNRTRSSDVTPSEQMPSGDGRYVRFDGVQGLSAGQQLQARENIGAGTGGGSSAWGGITGTLTDQTDLNTALGLKAPLASPTFTGTPAAPTAAGATSTTQIATTAFVAGEITTHAGAADPHGDRSFATSAVSTHAALTTGAHGITAAGAALLDDADAAAQRTTLGLGTAATTAATAYEASGAIATHNAVTTAHGISAYGATLVDDADASTARTTLGLGTAATSASGDFATAGHNHSGVYQPADAELTAIAGLTSAADSAPYFTGSGTAALMTVTAAGRALIDDADATAQRATLGLVIGTNVQAYDADLATWATITPGTGVGTALAVAVGSSGAFVTNGGALGTPSSGTLTNCTFPTLNQNTSGYAEALKSATTTVSVSAATAPSSGQVLTATSGTAATWQTPSGGLTGFTAAENTSSPNATVPVASLTANNAATNVDAAFKPKGAGAVLAQVPDSTATGGNKRGANAADWQTSRYLAAQVASGVSAVIGGGSNNTASADNATVGGGTTNTAGSSGTVAGGNTNTASGIASWIPGGYQATVRGLWGAYAYSSGQRSAQGDAQVTGQPVRRTTAATTTVQLSTDGATPTSTTVLVLPNNSGGQFEARVSAYQSTGCGGWKIEGTGYRGANAASTVIQGATTITAFGIVAGIGAPTVDVVADTTLGALVIQVTPANTTSTHWVGKLELIQVA